MGIWQLPPPRKATVAISRRPEAARRRTAIHLSLWVAAVRARAHARYYAGVAFAK